MALSCRLSMKVCLICFRPESCEHLPSESPKSSPLSFLNETLIGVFRTSLLRSACFAMDICCITVPSDWQPSNNCDVTLTWGTCVSQGSVATKLRWGRCLHYRFPWESHSETILKIRLYLQKLWSEKNEVHDLSNMPLKRQLYIVQNPRSYYSSPLFDKLLNLDRVNLYRSCWICLYWLQQ